MDAIALRCVLAHMYNLECLLDYRSGIFMTSVANSCEEIVAELRQSGLSSAAERIVDLQQLLEEDPDEPEMSLESLRQLTLFLVEERQLPAPDIGVGPDGLLGISWRIPERGIIAMSFLASGLIQFAATCGPVDFDIGPARVSGTLPRKETLKAVELFTDRIESK